eukprot:1050343-Lingulodinium_polyedra.AAC.1
MAPGDGRADGGGRAGANGGGSDNDRGARARPVGPVLQPTRAGDGAGTGRCGGLACFWSSGNTFCNPRVQT